MAAKKNTVRQESLLNTVARKLGHAAGTLTKTTQELTEALSALPEKVSAKVREGDDIGEPASRSRTPIRPRKKVSHAAGKHKSAAVAGKKRKPSKSKSRRRRSAA
jgi:hypothetical protein